MSILLVSEGRVGYIIGNISDIRQSGSSGNPLFFMSDCSLVNRKAKLTTDATTLSEVRLIEETGQDARVANIVAPVADDLGLRLVRVRLYDNNGLTLQIMAERHDGTMTVGECEKLSKAVSPVLDVEDPIPQAYNLEVSSPGIDRPLVRRSDFETWAGHVVKLETATMVNGRTRFKGQIIKVDGDDLHLHREDAGKDENPDYTVPLSALSSARLILTDDLIREALKRDKALREANGLDDHDLVEN